MRDLAKRRSFFVPNCRTAPLTLTLADIWFMIPHVESVKKSSLLPGFIRFSFDNHGRKWYNQTVTKQLLGQILLVASAIDGFSYLGRYRD
jgi:hypothetical protein